MKTLAPNDASLSIIQSGTLEKAVGSALGLFSFAQHGSEIVSEIHAHQWLSSYLAADLKWLLTTFACR
jgi:hypothetical protein